MAEEPETSLSGLEISFSDQGVAGFERGERSDSTGHNGVTVPSLSMPEIGSLDGVTSTQQIVDEPTLTPLSRLWPGRRTLAGGSSDTPSNSSTRVNFSSVVSGPGVSSGANPHRSRSSRWGDIPATNTYDPISTDDEGYGSSPGSPSSHSTSSVALNGLSSLGPKKPALNLAKSRVLAAGLQASRNQKAARSRLSLGFRVAACGLLFLGLSAFLSYWISMASGLQVLSILLAVVETISNTSHIGSVKFLGRTHVAGEVNRLLLADALAGGVTDPDRYLPTFVAELRTFESLGEIHISWNSTGVYTGGTTTSPHLTEPGLLKSNATECPPCVVEVWDAARNGSRENLVWTRDRIYDPRQRGWFHEALDIIEREGAPSFWILPYLGTNGYTIWLTRLGKYPCGESNFCLMGADFSVGVIQDSYQRVDTSLRVDTFEFDPPMLMLVDDRFGVLASTANGFVPVIKEDGTLNTFDNVTSAEEYSFCLRRYIEKGLGDKLNVFASASEVPIPPGGSFSCASAGEAIMALKPIASDDSVVPYPSVYSVVIFGTKKWSSELNVEKPFLLFLIGVSFFFAGGLILLTGVLDLGISQRLRKSTSNFVQKVLMKRKKKEGVSKKDTTQQRKSTVSAELSMSTFKETFQSFSHREQSIWVVIGFAILLSCIAVITFTSYNRGMLPARSVFQEFETIMVQKANEVLQQELSRLDEVVALFANLKQVDAFRDVSSSDALWTVISAYETTGAWPYITSAGVMRYNLTFEEVSPADAPNAYFLIEGSLAHQSTLDNVRLSRHEFNKPDSTEILTPTDMDIERINRKALNLASEAIVISSEDIFSTPPEIRFTPNGNVGLATQRILDLGYENEGGAVFWIGMHLDRIPQAIGIGTVKLYAVDGSGYLLFDSMGSAVVSENATRITPAQSSEDLVSLSYRALTLLDDIPVNAWTTTWVVYDDRNRTINALRSENPPWTVVYLTEEGDFVDSVEEGAINIVLVILGVMVFAIACATVLTIWPKYRHHSTVLTNSVMLHSMLFHGVIIGGMIWWQMGLHLKYFSERQFEYDPDDYPRFGYILFQISNIARKSYSIAWTLYVVGVLYGPRVFFKILPIALTLVAPVAVCVVLRYDSPMDETSDRTLSWIIEICDNVGPCIFGLLLMPLLSSHFGASALHFKGFLFVIIAERAFNVAFFYFLWNWYWSGGPRTQFAVFVLLKPLAALTRVGLKRALADLLRHTATLTNSEGHIGAVTKFSVVGMCPLFVMSFANRLMMMNMSELHLATAAASLNVLVDIAALRYQVFSKAVMKLAKDAIARKSGTASRSVQADNDDNRLFKAEMKMWSIECDVVTCCIVFVLRMSFITYHPNEELYILVERFRSLSMLSIVFGIQLLFSWITNWITVYMLEQAFRLPVVAAWKRQSRLAPTVHSLVICFLIATSVAFLTTREWLDFLRKINTDPLFV